VKAVACFAESDAYVIIEDGCCQLYFSYFLRSSVNCWNLLYPSPIVKGRDGIKKLILGGVTPQGTSKLFVDE